MATQSDAGSIVSALPEEHHEHFRLLELPPELLALLTADNPPTLQFKSLDGPTGSGIGSNAVLCSNDKTYTVRQVNTSNSVFLTRPGEVKLSADPEVLTEPCLEIFAQIGSMLEVSANARQSAIPYIKAALPVYASTGHAGAFKKSQDKEELFADIPLSQSECESAYTDLACFEFPDDVHSRDGAFVPSGEAKLRAWTSLLEYATSGGHDLTKPIGWSEADTFVQGTSDWPRPLSYAVLRAVCVGPVTEVEWYTVGETACRRFVGLSLLEARATSGCSLADFKAMWADAMPEKWRHSPDDDNDDLELLRGHYTLDGSIITYVEYPDIDGPKDAKSTLGAKRGWHERFRQNRVA